MNGGVRARSSLAVALACALATPTVARAQAADFTIVAVPDTQYYTCAYDAVEGPQCARSRGLYEEQMDWIADHRDDRSIRYVVSLGDCVENADQDGEYELASDAYGLLEGAVGLDFPEGIPYGVSVGNHDQYPVGNAGRIDHRGDVNDRDQEDGTELFNETFGVDRFCPRGVCRSYYGGHFGTNNDNHYDLFEANGYRFVVVSVEYMSSDSALRDAVLDWADDVLTAHADRRAIVVTHYVMDEGTDAPFSSLGEALYDRLKDHRNLFLMLGGHIPGEGRRSDTWDGRTVHTLLADYQGRNNGGDGWLRLLEVQPTRDRIKVRTYSPYRHRYETDGSSEFELPIDLSGGFPDQTASFQQGVDGYTGATDTFLDELGAAHDADDRLVWDGDPAKVALLRFGGLFASEGGPIPAGALIRSATLHYVTDDGGDEAELHHAVHAWWPGAGMVAPYGATPGAQPIEDYDPLVVGLAPGSVHSSGRRAHAVDVTASLLAWQAAPATNQGWVLASTGTGSARVRSAEAADPRDRPRLSITFVPDPCLTDAHCDDLQVCTADTCVDRSCRHAEIDACCAVDAECADGDLCTLDTCDPLGHTCVWQEILECEPPDEERDEEREDDDD